MGRTTPTYRDALRARQERWKKFRRGLRREEQEAFDRVMEKARAHADAAGYANPADPAVFALLSVVLEHERELAALRERIEAE